MRSQSLRWGSAALNRVNATGSHCEHSPSLPSLNSPPAVPTAHFRTPLHNTHGPPCGWRGVVCAYTRDRVETPPSCASICVSPRGRDSLSSTSCVSLRVTPFRQIHPPSAELMPPLPRHPHGAWSLARARSAGVFGGAIRWTMFGEHHAGHVSRIVCALQGSGLTLVS